jgi:drug/metabolite transporter (DMT)-like permease
MYTESLAKLACALSGVTWGVFWIPMRALSAAGVAGAWAGFAFYLVPALLLLPFSLWRWREVLRGGWRLQWTGLWAGVSLVAYSDAVVFTEVIRAVLLFYLTPLWSTLLARAVLGEPITRVRWISMALAFGGLLVLFGIDRGLPVPRNAGDWMGLLSGLAWAVAAVRLRADRGSHPLDLLGAYFVWGAVFAAVVALVPFSGNTTPPDLSRFAATLPWLLPVIALIVVPGAFAAIWASMHLDPGLVGLLFMTEITVGALTAALFAGEPFGVREVLGVALISSAGLIETIPSLRTKRRPSEG